MIQVLFSIYALKMKYLYSPWPFLLLTSLFCLSPISVNASEDIYRYHGLKLAEGEKSVDGIYQDFSQDNATVGKLWADPDARSHEGNDYSWIKSHVNRYQKLPFLSVEFARHGHGVNLTVIPQDLIPEKLPGRSLLTFEARSNDPACFGLRYMDRDGEVWGYGTEPLNYDRLCVNPGNEWTRFSIPIEPNHSNWFKFNYSGNVDLGNNEMEGDLIAGLQFELGLLGKDYFAPGTATFDLQDIRIKKDRTPTKRTSLLSLTISPITSMH
jgi:hypothetical protein